MRYISMFAGIEAATVAWHPLGWEPVAFAETDPFASAVLRHHYPDVPNVGDMTAHDWSRYRGACDLVVGGPPCQAFSVAGLRRSLTDDRGNLSLAYVRAIRAIDPVWSLTENVPGWLSTDDNAFGCVLAGLVGAGTPLVPPAAAGGHWTDAGVVTGPERTAAWRVLDAQYLGLAQRRERVFVLSVRGAGNFACADALFLVGPRLSGDPPPRREAGQGVAPSLAARTRGGGGLGTDFDCDGGLIQSCFTEISARQWVPSEGTWLAAHEAKEAHTLIAHALRAEGFDASEDGTGRGTPLVPCPGFIHPRQLRNSQSSNQVGIKPDAEVSDALTSEGPGAVLAFDTTQVTSKLNRSVPRAGDPCHPLAAGAHPPAIAIQGGSQQDQFCPPGSVVPTLAHSSNVHAGHHQPKLWDGMAVRRLTPLECCRLQGFPDDYLDITYRGKPAADGPKYKALGNSMAVPVIAWMGRRIAMVEALASAEAVA